MKQPSNNLGSFHSDDMPMQHQHAYSTQRPSVIQQMYAHQQLHRPVQSPQAIMQGDQVSGTTAQALVDSLPNLHPATVQSLLSNVVAAASANDDEANNFVVLNKTHHRTGKTLTIRHLNLTDFKRLECPRKNAPHNHKSCYYFHSIKDKRRDDDLYTPELCKFADTEKCPKRDKCRRAHNRVERLYHKDKYKTKFCHCYPNKIQQCEYGEYCSFAHSVEDIKVRLIHHLLPQHADFDFYMFFFKTEWCPYNHDHNKAQCVYAHNFQDFRRKPNLFRYDTELCEDWQSGTFITCYEEGCKRLERCTFSHGWKEQQFHPLVYKTSPCEEQKCFKGFECPFYHSSKDQRIIEGHGEELKKLFEPKERHIKCPQQPQIQELFFDNNLNHLKELELLRVNTSKAQSTRRIVIQRYEEAGTTEFIQEDSEGKSSRSDENEEGIKPSSLHSSQLSSTAQHPTLQVEQQLSIQKGRKKELKSSKSFGRGSTLDSTGKHIDRAADILPQWPKHSSLTQDEVQCSTALIQESEGSLGTDSAELHGSDKAHESQENIKKIEQQSDVVRIPFDTSPSGYQLASQLERNKSQRDIPHEQTQRRIIPEHEQFVPIQRHKTLTTSLKQAPLEFLGGAGPQGVGNMYSTPTVRPHQVPPQHHYGGMYQTPPSLIHHPSWDQCYQQDVQYHTGNKGLTDQSQAFYPQRAYAIQQRSFAHQRIPSPPGLIHPSPNQMMGYHSMNMHPLNPLPYQSQRPHQPHGYAQPPMRDDYPSFSPHHQAYHHQQQPGLQQPLQYDYQNQGGYPTLPPSQMQMNTHKQQEILFNSQQAKLHFDSQRHALQQQQQQPTPPQNYNHQESGQVFRSSTMKENLPESPQFGIQQREPIGVQAIPVRKLNFERETPIAKAVSAVELQKKVSNESEEKNSGSDNSANYASAQDHLQQEQTQIRVQEDLTQQNKILPNQQQKISAAQLMMKSCPPPKTTTGEKSFYQDKLNELATSYNKFNLDFSDVQEEDFDLESDKNAGVTSYRIAKSVLNDDASDPSGENNFEQHLEQLQQQSLSGLKVGPQGTQQVLINNDSFGKQQLNQHEDDEAEHTKWQHTQSIFRPFNVPQQQQIMYQSQHQQLLQQSTHPYQQAYPGQPLQQYDPAQSFNRQAPLHYSQHQQRQYSSMNVPLGHGQMQTAPHQGMLEYRQQHPQYYH